MTAGPVERGSGSTPAPSPFWWRGASGPVQLGFTSVHAGNLAHHVGPQAEVGVNRRRLESSMHVPEGSLRFLDQVHSAEVRSAQDPGVLPAETPVPTGDAWISADGSAPLAIMVADCLPVLLHGRRSRDDPAAQVPVTAAAHAGRPGLLAGVLENTVAAMREHRAVSISAWIGPGACGDCYEIPQAMVTEVSADRPAIASTTSWGTSALDLRAEARSVLGRQNVAVAELSGCTIEDETLFSHRRAPGRGRFAGVIWIPAMRSPAR